MRFSFCLVYSAALIALFNADARALQPNLKVSPRFLDGSAPPLVPPTPSDPPPGPAVSSLAEWEEADEVMTLWANPDWIRALTQRGKVRLLADTPADQDWWKQWLADNQIDSSRISYFVTPTDSIWVRDYGPFYVLDGLNRVGIVHNTYNRPRPLDNQFPQFLATTLQVPYFETGLVHTGGNYYSDGLGKAFSSTLVETENPALTLDQIQQRVLSFLGISAYFTAPLAPKITIEHMDTFGKLVSPDTWVFSEFPAGSVYKSDSDAMADRLSKMISPYGLPYKVLRIKMIQKHEGDPAEDYRGYINSFISNQTLYLPAYGDASDDYAKSIYQSALPGYEIVGVPALATEWGDSVHCRSKNLIKRDTIFIHPQIYKPLDAFTDVYLFATIVPSPDARIVGYPTLCWRRTTTGKSFEKGWLNKASNGGYILNLPALAAGETLSMYIEATDSSGITKRFPETAPSMTIDLTLP